MEPTIQGENSDSTPPAVNAPSVTRETLLEKMDTEFHRLTEELANARIMLEDASQALKDFKNAVSKAEDFYHPAFGHYTSKWEDRRWLTNGDSVVIEQGSDSETEKDSICETADKLHQQAEPFSFDARQFLKEYRDRMEEIETESYSHGD